MAKKIHATQPLGNVFEAFLPILHFSRLLGIFPLSYAPGGIGDRHSKHTGEQRRRGPSFEPSRLARVYSLALFLFIISVFFTTLHQAINAFSVFGNERANKIQIQFVSALLLFLASFNAFMDLYFTATNGKCLRKIFSSISRVDKKLRHPVVPKELGPHHSRLRRLAIIQMVIVLAAVIFQILVDYAGSKTDRQTYSYLISFHVIRLISFTLEQQFVNVVLILRDRLKLVNECLKDAITRPEVPDVLSSSSPFIWRKIRVVDTEKKWSKNVIQGRRLRNGSHINLSAVKVKEVRLAHFWLCEEAKVVNEAYQVPLLAIILGLFFDIISGGYFLLDDFLSGSEKVSAFLSSITWVSQGTVRIGCLSWVAWDTSETAMKAKRYILKMREMIMPPAVEEELKIFLDYLLQGKIQFNICGFIPLDMAMAQAIAQASTSYLLVLLQLRRSE